jgi:hypothetical protein
MISSFLSLVIIGLMVVLVVYPAFHLLRQTWQERQRRAPKPPR